ncbi:hypothetical protein [Chryseobacterium sp. 3008163]|uniref:hypothetical protein n=1 Tax=Chryseobacterium sp. 3008163 TaxID=2478663 RepID=UPI000F0CBFCF|nr:hypothetical protein [Chryseobacterium sp. 3008163]AYN01354.1 hypothetical protein EAG08_14470 [Chryseobacterium sp. 3008163]
MNNIKNQLLNVQKDIISSLDNSFVNYLLGTTSIFFTGNYPQSYENLLLIGTNNLKVKINDEYISPYSEEFINNPINNREYIVNLSFLHTYCFSLFTNFFEFLYYGLPFEGAKEYYKEFEFFLNTQIISEFDEYNISYKNHWLELLSRVDWVLEYNNHSFAHLFNHDLQKEIRTYLNGTIDSLK